MDGNHLAQFRSVSALSNLCIENYDAYRTSMRSNYFILSDIKLCWIITTTEISFFIDEFLLPYPYPLHRNEELDILN
jgi:hypothetical protein